MNPLRLWGQGLVVLLLAWGTSAAAEPSPAGDAGGLAEKIDQHIGRRWVEAKVQPAALADDAEYQRRVYLDLAGRIPSVAESRMFLDDKRSDKRVRLVEELLAGSRYVNHFTNVWRALLLPEANNNFQVRLQQGGFEGWLKQQVARNVGWDQLARDIVKTPVAGQGPLAFLGQGDPNPLAFYLAKEFKPENLAAGTARVFLGISVECAQCHHHPFADWKKEQFWSFAAFYSGIKPNRLMDFLLPGPDDAQKREIAIPGTDKVVQAKFIDGTDPQWKAEVGTRATLAEWLTSPSNPYFARAAVNRTWAYFFGTGLVEPVDEMVGATSTCSHPELLDLLAKEFVAHQFDVKILIRAITASRAYQLTSARTPPANGVKGDQDEPSLFAWMPLRGLTAEQLFDSVAAATGYRDSGGGNELLAGLLGGNRSARAEFLTKFANQSERAVESQTSILQALSLMNGKVIGSATSLERSETLLAVVDAPFLSTAQRIETLYLATLSRMPKPKEIERTVKFVQDAVREANGAGEATRQTAYRDALADVFWALLNSPEFVLNH
jgi:hypothetical protein